MLRIAVLDDYQGVSGRYADWSTLPEAAEVTVFRDHLGDEDAVADRLAPFDVVVAMRERTPFPRSLLERLPNLRLLVTTGAKNAAIDVAAATERGIVVCGTASLPSGTPELTWALILATARHLPEEVANVRAGGWQTTVGTDLAGARLGVIGLGRLGSRVARIGQAFEMDVVAWSANLTDEHALVPALQEQRIAGAGMDVYDTEPLPAGSPLRRLANVVATPHLGYVTHRTYELFYREAVEDVAAWMRGEPLRQL